MHHDTVHPGIVMPRNHAAKGTGQALAVKNRKPSTLNTLDGRQQGATKTCGVLHKGKLLEFDGECHRDSNPTQPNETENPLYHKLSMDIEGIVLLSMRYSRDVSLAYRESPVDIRAKPLD